MRRFAFLCFLSVGCSSSSFTIAPGGEVGVDGTVTDGGGGDTQVDDTSIPPSDVAPEACVDKKFCAEKCGLGLIDACGERRDCATDCGSDKTCDGVTHKCICVPVPADVWCMNRCGANKDNCGNAIECGACVTGICTLGSCGCLADADSTTCKNAGYACGETKNNCLQTVSCGVCPSGQSCVIGKCCDTKAVTCAGKCGSVVNSCGATVDCGGCSGSTTCCKNLCVNTQTDVANCGGCNASCSTIPNSNACEGGGCTCTGHGSNTDPTACGPCAAGGMNCSKGGRSRCTAGVCF